MHGGPLERLAWVECDVHAGKVKVPGQLSSTPMQNVAEMIHHIARYRVDPDQICPTYPVSAVSHI